MLGWESYIVVMRWPVPHFHSAVTAGLILWLGCGLPVHAQDARPPGAQAEPPAETTPESPAVPGQENAAPIEPAAPSEPTREARLREREDLDALFAELAQPEGETWARAESDILRIWSRSGSASMDLLAKRGEAAMDAGDNRAAIGHLTALTDHAPDYANGWYLLGVAYYLDGDLGPAISAMAEVIKREPRHFGALTQLGSMLEELGDDRRALEAYRASLRIHPHQQDAQDAVTRLEALTKGTDA